MVFEAKHISKSFDSSDTDGIKKEAKRRLGETCDGTQMNEPWSERRIPQALRRSVKGGDMTPDEMDRKITEIKTARYARWMFICLPGGAGTGSKLFVLIDVVASGMDLDKSPVTPESTPSQPGANTF
ncbi:hypothetical protein [Paraburkholderia bannensis]|uniref:hypothetical protein n=1 Tax=Paraburkholderia bannensis TaxID=765414 RepID=UPI002AC35036|nr:hypothetical protein [Paraburkholderia bannensis]